MGNDSKNQIYLLNFNRNLVPLCPAVRVDFFLKKKNKK